MRFQFLDLAASLTFFLTVVPVLAQQTSFPLTVLSASIDTSAPHSISRSAGDIELGDGGRWSYFQCAPGQTLGGGSYTSRCLDDNANLVTSMEILRNGKLHAHYDNIFDGAFSNDGQYFAIRNAVKQKDGTFIEELRIINVASKKFIFLPLEECTTNTIRWSQGKLITTSDLPLEVGKPSVICVWSVNGKLLGKVAARGLTTATTQRPINRVGLLPREKNTLYVLGWFDRDPSRPCQLVAVDLTDSIRRVVVSFDPGIETYYCAGDAEGIELDLSKFTLERPLLRFRVRKTNHQGPSTTEVVSPWKVQ